MDCVVLEEEIDPLYEPSEKEVIEYAEWIGMDPHFDKDLLWIAREGLKAPLPKNWKPCRCKNSDDIYYFNFRTGESTWEHPCDVKYGEILMNDVPHIKEHNTKVSRTTTTTMTLEGDEDEEKYVHNKRTISANRTGRHKRASSRHHIPKEEGQEEVESKFKPYTSTEQYINRSIENWARVRRDAQRMVRIFGKFTKRRSGVFAKRGAVVLVSKY